jgi:hypothetical protein
VRLLAFDEHRLGLRPVYRRVWARRGERPVAVGAHRYRWFYVCTFVEPETGESLSLLVDGVDTEVMGWVLRELRAWLGEGEEAWVVLDWSFCRPTVLSCSLERVWPFERGGGQSVLPGP